ncbi:MAG: universal stress protein, partial [Candidatus Dormibacteria bacterium]
SSNDFDLGVAPIVVGVSPTTYSLAALRWAALEAGWRRAPLHAVMAWRPPRPPTAPATRPPAVLSERNDELQAAAYASLEQAVTSVISDSERVRLSVVRGGAVAVLLAAAEGAQLLVLGVTHPGRVSGAIRDVLQPPPISRRVSCPVVLIPPALREDLLADLAPRAQAG